MQGRIRMRWSILISGLLFLITLNSKPAFAQTNVFDHHFYWGKIKGVWVQGPLKPIVTPTDCLVDIESVGRWIGLSSRSYKDERIFEVNHHHLMVQANKRAAMLDGHTVIYQTAPKIVQGAFFVPFQQTLKFLGIPFRMEKGDVNILKSSDAFTKLQSSVSDHGKESLIYLGVIDGNRFLAATRPKLYGKFAGLGALYEVKFGSPAAFALNKLRSLSDTSVSIHMETLSSGSVKQNLFFDLRPELIVVESCACAGKYNYATMFTITEMGLTSIWHSQYSYDRIERTPKGWELVSYRKEHVPERSPSDQPYWEVRETWTGTQFSVIKETYHPSDKR